VIGGILVVGALVIFIIGVAAGRYANWFGVAVPVAVTVALGYGWEWAGEAMLFVIAAALLGGLGFAGGVRRRRTRHSVRG